MSSVNAPVPADPRVEQRLEAETRQPVPTSPKRPGIGGHVWWRHALAVLALIWALFPIVFLISAALNPAGTLSSSELIPKSFSLNNFETLFNDPARPFATWFRTRSSSPSSAPSVRSSSGPARHTPSPACASAAVVVVC